MYYIQMVFFFVDIVLNFLTAYITEDLEIVYDRKAIANRYVFSFPFWFFIDLVSNLPEFPGPFGRQLKVLKALRLLRMPRVLNRMAQRGASQKSLTVFKVVVGMFTSGHLLACVWYGMANGEKDKRDSWIHSYGVSSIKQCQAAGLLEGYMNPNGTWTGDFENCAGNFDDLGNETEITPWQQWLASMYWAYATLTTVGYGDISATTQNERVLALLACVGGSALFATIIGMMASLMETDDVRELDLHKKIIEVNLFMSRHAIPNDMRERIRHYYEVMYFNGGHQEILSDLPSHLQRELLLSMYAEFIQLVPFLQDADSSLVTCILEKMFPVTCVPKEFIMIEGELVKNLCVVKSGRVEVIDPTGVLTRTYGEGSFFGERCGLVEYYYAENSFRSKTDVELMAISHQDLFHLLEAFPDFALTLEDIAEKRAEHEREQQNGQSAKLAKQMKAHMQDLRPVTPPLGKKWMPVTKDPADALPTKARERDTLRQSMIARYSNVGGANGMPPQSPGSAMRSERAARWSTVNSGNTQAVVAAPQANFEGAFANGKANATQAAAPAGLSSADQAMMTIGADNAEVMANSMRTLESHISSLRGDIQFVRMALGGLVLVVVLQVVNIAK